LYEILQDYKLTGCTDYVSRDRVKTTVTGRSMSRAPRMDIFEVLLPYLFTVASLFNLWASKVFDPHGWPLSPPRFLLCPQWRVTKMAAEHARTRRMTQRTTSLRDTLLSLF